MPEKSAGSAKTRKATGTTKTAKKSSAAKAAKRPARTKAAAAKVAATTAVPGARVRVRQVRSGIGHAQTFRRTLTALGLKHHQAEVVLPDTPSVRGMLFKVRHLVRVTPEEV